MIRSFLTAVTRKLRSMWRSRCSPPRPSRRGPGDGPEGAGVTARLKPRPPVLVAQFAEPLPDSEDAAA